MANIIADGDEELFQKFLEIIMLNNNLMDKYNQKLIDKTTKEVTDSVAESVTDSIAKNLKDVLSDEVIAVKTGLDIEVVRQL